MKSKVQEKYKKKGNKKPPRIIPQGRKSDRRPKGEKPKRTKEEQRKILQNDGNTGQAVYTFSPVSCIVKTVSKEQFRTPAIFSNSETVKSFLFSFVVKYWREIPIAAARRVIVKPRRRIKSLIFSDIVKMKSPF